jgi:hypothetical protein
MLSNVEKMIIQQLKAKGKEGKKKRVHEGPIHSEKPISQHTEQA